MPDQCPPSATPGHTRDAGALLRRALAWLRRLVRRPDSTVLTNKAGRRHSNAEYHLTQGQVRRIIGAGSSSRDRTLLRLLAETGIRRSEACALGITDVRIAERLVLIRYGKGGKPRLVPVTDGLAADLRRLTVTAKGNYIFAGRHDGPLSARQMNRIVAGAGRRAGIRNPNPNRSQVTCHLLRHSFARLWKEKRGSIESLSRILGHASVKTTWDLYGTEGLNDIQRNYRRIMGKKGAGLTKDEEVTGDEDK